MSTDRPSPGEFDLIAEFRRRSQSSNRVAIGIGDDCASIRVTTGAELLVTTDMLMEGRHFLADTPLRAVGYKCLAVNLSDIAAMAGLPIAAVVAVALPRGRAAEVGLELHAGMIELAEEVGVPLVGGDTNAWDGPLVVAVTVFGESNGRGPVRRLGAKPGDVIFVTGPLGGSILGRHLSPRPRIAEALALHDAVALHAMIDISDGLASDLGHILEESGGLGAILDTDSIPIHPDAVTLSSRDGRSPLEHALGDGEDFELCFTVGADDAARLLAVPPSGVFAARVGVIVEGEGIWLRGAHGRVERCEIRGFDHLRAGSIPPPSPLVGEGRGGGVAAGQAEAERTSTSHPNPPPQGGREPERGIVLIRPARRLTVALPSEDATAALGRALATLAEPGQVIGLIGGLGAGKTRLARAFAEALDVDPAAIASPTFVLIHEYKGRLPIYHFDAYRLAGPDDFDALGAAEYFATGGVCLVEWADIVLDRLPRDAWFVRLTPNGPASRSAEIEASSGDLDRIAEALRLV
jgi:thiamine-monophosphate kinase